MTADAARRSEDKAALDAEPDDFRLSESPAHLLRRAQQYAAGIFHQAGLSGVTLRQSVVLAAIAEAEGRSQAELVKATGIDRSTLADMIARMEKKGLVARARAEDDGRAKAVSLTADGRGKLDEALPAMRGVDDALSEALPKNRRTAFRDMLGALASAADESEFFEIEEDAKAKPKKQAKAGAKGKKKGRKDKRKRR
jgi:DNA-binding MarR family transcriptional regulator